MHAQMIGEAESTNTRLENRRHRLWKCTQMFTEQFVGQTIICMRFILGFRISMFPQSNIAVEVCARSSACALCENVSPIQTFLSFLSSSLSFFPILQVRIQQIYAEQKKLTSTLRLAFCLSQSLFQPLLSAFHT